MSIDVLRAENARLREILLRAWDDHMAAFEVCDEDQEWLLAWLDKDLQERWAKNCRCWWTMYGGSRPPVRQQAADCPEHPVLDLDAA